MKLLLDTHIFLWSLLEPTRLSERVAAALENPLNELWVSPIVTWEILLLAERGRLALEPDAATWVRRACRAVAFREAPLTHEVAIEGRAIDLGLVTADERLLRSRRIASLANT